MLKIQPGEPFPQLKGTSVNHGEITFPDDIPAGNYGVLLAYRAHW